MYVILLARQFVVNFKRAFSNRLYVHYFLPNVLCQEASQVRNSYVERAVLMCALILVCSCHAVCLLIAFERVGVLLSHCRQRDLT